MTLNENFICLLTFTSIMYLGCIVKFSTDKQKALTSICPDGCILKECLRLNYYASKPKVKEFKYPCECSYTDSLGATSTYCNKYAENRDPSFLEAHPQFVPNVMWLSVSCGCFLLLAAYCCYERRTTNVRVAANVETINENTTEVAINPQGTTSDVNLLDAGRECKEHTSPVTPELSFVV